ncbi:MAG: oligogalacturonate lyase family protein [Prolixibacteraceae bacterium]|nr:oligogalacturonate lyase family protein [Prolixibacteraceae bacterium]
MKKNGNFLLLLIIIVCFCIQYPAKAQIGSRFPSEKKIVTDPVTGVKLTFLTSTPAHDSKIYQTHNQWTSDGNWVIFRSERVKGEAMAVNEKSGDIVQVSEGGFIGMLSVARKSMKLYFMRKTEGDSAKNKLDIVEVDLGKLFADSKSGTLKKASVYQRICGTTPSSLEAGGDMALDGGEEWAWFRVGKTEAQKHLPEGTKIEGNFGPRNMGAGPAGVAGMNIHTGEIKYVVSVSFQIGHIQNNPWVPGQIIFCWETGGKAPQRTWIVNSDGTGLRPLYPESPYEWITHEAVISKDEVAFAIMGHRKIANSTGETVTGTGGKIADPGLDPAWGPCGTREKPSGLGIVNINTREMTIVGQIPKGSGFWHVNGSTDGRFAAGDDFERNLYLIDRRTHEMMLLTTGHKATAADHPHPTFSPDGTRIEIQSAMLSADNRSMNICIVPLPQKWLERK